MNDSSDPKKQLQARIQDLGTLFVQRTSSEVTAMQESLARVRGGERGELEPLQFLAHKIHGTGATLGFAAISEQAGALERLIVSRSIDAPIDQAWLESLAASVARLVDEVKRAE